MVDYIKRSDCLDMANDLFRDILATSEEEVAAMAEDIELEVRQMLHCVPTADVVPVVYCKDCAYYKAATDEELSECKHPSGCMGFGMGGLFFCAGGKVKMSNPGNIE